MKELTIAKMRYVIALCAILASASMRSGVAAQSYGTISDTISVVELADTLYLYPGGAPYLGAVAASSSRSFDEPCAMSAVFEADSISGSTGAVLYIEVSNGEYSPFLWVPAGSIPINGAGKTLYVWTDELFAYRKWRAKVVSSGDAQQTGITCQWTFKPLRR